VIGPGLWFPEGAKRQLPKKRWSINMKGKTMLRRAVGASAGAGPEKLDASIVSPINLLSMHEVGGSSSWHHRHLVHVWRCCAIL